MQRIICFFLLMAGVAFGQDGRTTFAKRCSVCHGVDGHGSERGPNLANNRRVRSRSMASLSSVIRNGVAGAGMPAFDLPAAELLAVTLFVRSLSAPAAESNAPGDREAGAAFFLVKADVRVATWFSDVGRQWLRIFRWWAAR